jgi:hypothetical protein
MGQSPMLSNSFNKDSIEMTNMFIKSSWMQYYDNNDDIYDHDGIEMNEILLVSRKNYPLLNN